MGEGCLKVSRFFYKGQFFFRALFLQSYVKNAFFTSKTRFFVKNRQKSRFFVKKHVYWASWRSPRPPPDPPKAAPRPPRASSGLGLGQEANWGDSGGAQIPPKLRFPLFFDDLALIPGFRHFNRIVSLNSGSGPPFHTRQRLG